MPIPPFRCAFCLPYTLHMPQNAEVQEMKFSMEHMRMIIQIQAQIDSCLIDGGETLSSSLARDAGGEPDPRLVKQAIRLLRMRHRVLRVRTVDNDSTKPFGNEDLFEQHRKGYSGLNACGVGTRKGVSRSSTLCLSHVVDIMAVQV